MILYNVDILTCIIAYVIVGIDATDLVTLQHIVVPNFAIDWVVQHVIDCRCLDIFHGTSYLQNTELNMGVKTLQNIRNMPEEPTH